MFALWTTPQARGNADLRPLLSVICFLPPTSNLCPFRYLWKGMSLIYIVAP